MRLYLITPILKKIADYGSWIIFFLILTYSTLFYFTRNTLPGEFFYPVKLSVEKILISSSRLLYKSVEFEIDFVARRFDEVTKVLSSKYGQESLQRLDGQVTDTAETIANIKDPQARKEAAEKYVIQLSYISSGLAQEEKKIIQKTPTYYPAPTYSPVVNLNNIEPTATPPPPPIVTEIDNTQEIIQNTIEEMTQIQTQTQLQTSEPTATPIPTKTPIPIQPTATPIPTQASQSSKSADKPAANENASFNQPIDSPTSTPIVSEPTPTPVLDIPTSTPEPTVINGNNN